MGYNWLEESCERAIATGYEGYLDAQKIVSISNGKVCLELYNLLCSVRQEVYYIPDLVDVVYCKKEQLYYFYPCKIVFNANLQYIGVQERESLGSIDLASFNTKGMYGTQPDLDFRKCNKLYKVEMQCFSDMKIGNLYLSDTITEIEEEAFRDSSIGYFVANGVKNLGMAAFYNAEVYKFHIGEKSGLSILNYKSLLLKHTAKSAKKEVYINKEPEHTYMLRSMNVVYMNVSLNEIKWYHEKLRTNIKNNYISDLLIYFYTFKDCNIKLYLLHTNKDMSLRQVKALKYVPFGRNENLQVYIQKD